MARKVEYQLTANADGFTRAVSGARKEFESFGNAIVKGVGFGAGFSVGTKAAEALLGAVKAVPGALLDATRAAIEFGGRVDDLSKKTGINAEALQRLGAGAKLAGTSMEAVGAAVGTMQKAIVAGDSSFKALGLSVQQLKAAAPEQAFAQIAEKITALKTPTEQAAAAMAIFGKSGAELLPLMKSQFAEAGAEAEKLGQVLSGPSIAALDNMGDRIDVLKGTWEGLQNQVGAIIAQNEDVQDGLEALISSLGDAAKWISDNTDLLRDMASVLGDVARGFAAVAREMAAGAVPGWLRDLVGGGVGGGRGLLGALEALPIFGGAITNARQLAAIGAASRSASGAAGRGVRNYSGYTGPTGATPTPGGPVFDPEALKRAEAELKRYNKAVRDLENAYRDAWRAFIGAGGPGTGGPMPGMRAGMGGLFGTGPLEGEGSYGGAVPGVASQADMEGALRRQALIDAGYTYGYQQRQQINRDAADAARRTIDWNRALGDLAQTFLVLAGNADSAMGRILTGFAAAAAAGLAVRDTLRANGGWGNTNGTERLGIALSGVQTAAGIYRGARGQGRGMGALGGAAQGAAFGSAFGPWGTAIGGAVGGILGFFGGGRRADEPIRTLAQRFQELQRAAAETGVAGERALLNFIRREKESGQAIPEVQAYIKANVDAATTATAGLLARLKIETARDGKMVAAIFAGSFAASLKERGLIATVDAFKDVWAKMMEQFAKAGIDPASMPGMGDFGRLMELGQNEAFRDVAEAAQYAAEMLRALGDSAYLSEEQFGATGDAILQLFNRALQVPGASRQDAMTAVWPAILQYIKESERYGYSIPPEMADIIAEAMANGFRVPLSVEERQLDMLGQIRDAIRGIKVAEGTFPDRLPPTTTPSDEPGGGGGVGGGRPGRELAAGDIIPPAPGGRHVLVAEAGQAELAAPVRSFSRQMVGDFAAMLRNTGMGGGSPSAVVRFDVDRRTLAEAQLGAARRNVAGARNQYERIAAGRRP